MRSDGKGRHSKAIHGGLDPAAHHGAVSVPIYQTSSFAFPSAEEGAARFAGTSAGPIYTRLGNNPTVVALASTSKTQAQYPLRMLELRAA